MELLTGEDRHETAVAWAFVSVQLLLLVVIGVAPPGDAWSATGWAVAVASTLQWVGVGVLVVGLVSLGRSLTPLPTPVPHGVLQTRGLYRLVRHPIYTGVLALAAGVAIRSGSPLIAGAAFALAVLFGAKARWEEARLRRRYPGYEAYAARTPRFVPLWPFGADRSS